MKHVGTSAAKSLARWREEIAMLILQQRNFGIRSESGRTRVTLCQVLAAPPEFVDALQEITDQGA